MGYTQEELAALLEKAQKEAQAALDKMTPEQRAQAEERARQAIAEDAASMRKLIDDAAKIAGTAVTDAPAFCPNCGAKAGGGNFCEYCGSPLKG